MLVITEQKFVTTPKGYEFAHDDCDVSTYKGFALNQILIVCNSGRPMSIEDIKHDFGLEFEIDNEVNQETRNMFDYAIENVVELCRYLLTEGYLRCET